MQSLVKTLLLKLSVLIKENVENAFDWHQQTICTLVMSGVVDVTHCIKDKVLGIKVNGSPSYTLTPKQGNNHESEHKVQCL